MMVSPLRGNDSTGTRSSAPERMKTSDSAASLYCGNPFSVFREILGTGSDHPSPYGPFPAPASYESVRLGPNPPRPADVNTGTENPAVPVCALAENFSP